MVKQSRKLFVAGPSLQSKIIPNPYGPISLPRSNFNKVDINAAVGYLDKMAPGFRQQAGDHVKQAAVDYLTRTGNEGLRQVRNYAINKLNSGNREGNPPVKPVGKNNAVPFPGGKPMKEFDPTVFSKVKSNLSYALSPAPIPMKISLNSGIKPNTFVNDYMNPVESACSPLHLTSVTLALPTKALNPLNPLANYFEDTILFDLMTKAQEKISFNIDLTTFSTANIASAFNDAIYALQVYFYYSSVMSYSYDSRNNNSGMAALRQLIDAQTLSDYAQLGKRIEDLPVPPRILEWVRYMSGNYFTGSSQGSPLCRIAVTSQSFLSPPATSLCATALTRLSQGNNLSIWSILRRANPQWRIGRLYDIPSTPVYDAQFKTIFANLQTQNRYGGPNAYLNTATNLNTQVPYNSFTNKLDGLAFAMCSTYDPTVGILTSYPGLVTSALVNTTYTDNRYSYYVVAGVKGFYPVQANPFLAIARAESFLQVGATVYSPHLSGADRCQNVTGNALIVSAQAVLDFLFNAANSYSKVIKYVS